MSKFCVRSAYAVCITMLSACGTVPIEDAAPLPKRTDDPCFIAFVDEAKVLAEFDATPDCCAGIENFDFKKLLNNPTELHAPSLDEGGHLIAVASATPIFTFPTGRSRFVARDISTFKTAPKQVTLLLHSGGFTTPAKKCSDVKMGSNGITYGEVRYFVPLITFLDSNKRPLAAGVAGTPTLVQGEPALSYVVPTGTRSIVVYSDAGSYGRPLRMEGDKSWDLSFMPGKTPLIFPVFKDRSISGVATTSGYLRLFFH